MKKSIIKTTRPSASRRRFVLASVLLALVAGMAWAPPAAADDREMGTGTLKIKFKQWPAAGNLDNAYFGNDPSKCLVNIRFQGIFSSTNPGWVYYRAVHSDGTKSSKQLISEPVGNGKEFTYQWNKYIPPNQPYSGWVMIEAWFIGSPGYLFKSAKAAFTVQCIPHEARKWLTAPVIVTPTQNQKVSGGSIVVKPYHPEASKCADGGIFSLDWQYLDTLTSTWKPIKKLSKPWICVPGGSVKDISGMQPGLYKIRAQERNAKYDFVSDWSDWVTFEVVGVMR